MNDKRDSSFLRYLRRSYWRNAIEATSIFGVIVVICFSLATVMGEVPYRSPIRTVESISVAVLAILVGGLFIGVQLSFSRWLRDNADRSLDGDI
jgi:hypothetical protein